MPDSQDPTELKRVSKALSWLLRHGANEVGLAMDPAGWVALADVRGWLAEDAGLLEAVVARNNKARFQVSGERLRASQGHSLAGTPVTLEALEGSWTVWDGSGSLWHGTSVGAVEGIAREGILAVARTHVHLAEGTDSVVGKRAGVHVMLEVSAERLRGLGVGIWVSPNGVVLVREVPVGGVVGLVGLTSRGRGEEERLKGLLGLC